MLPLESVDVLIDAAAGLELTRNGIEATTMLPLDDVLVLKDLLDSTLLPPPATVEKITLPFGKVEVLTEEV